MIMTASDFRRFVETEVEDQALEAKLRALELSIRAYTNNNFMARAFRAVADAIADGQKLICANYIPLECGATLQITGSLYMPDYLVTVDAISGDEITVKERIYNEQNVVITRVFYPADIKMGVANLLQWELNNRDKVGVSSESISRHSVTYFDMNGDNSLMGYPKSLLGFLAPYKRARF